MGLKNSIDIRLLSLTIISDPKYLNLKINLTQRKQKLKIMIFL